jgi:hypothetical protein
MEGLAPVAAKHPPTPAASRFWQYVDQSGGPDACWPWMGTRIAEGYGQILEYGRKRPATHVALEIAGSPVPPGLFALHHCDNPPCVNPTHLFIGNQTDNARDKMAKGRFVLGVRDAAWSEAAAKRTGSVWANYTPEQRLDRINRSRVAMGLAPRTSL